MDDVFVDFHKVLYFFIVFLFDDLFVVLKLLHAPWLYVHVLFPH